MRYNGGARLTQLFALAGVLELVGEAVVAEISRRTAPPPRSRGATLRPGRETPLWLALVNFVEPELRTRGAKAALARELALHRSQISKYFKRRTAMPDAERTLQLILWLEKRRAQGGREARRR